MLRLNRKSLIKQQVSRWLCRSVARERGAALIELSILCVWLVTITASLFMLGQLFTEIDGLVRSNYEASIYGAGIPSASHNVEMQRRAALLNNIQGPRSRYLQLQSSYRSLDRTLSVSQSMLVSSFFGVPVTGSVTSTTPFLLLSTQPTSSNEFQNPTPRFDCSGQRCNLLVDPQCGQSPC
ncbi:MAG: hypothetical protein K1X79_03060 [Oligoflexia bacterium]|nr:hypothetical protein [Oligoflexia bacterium]